MKNNLKLLVLFLFIISARAKGQFNPVKLEVAIHRAVEKAYPASVRIWGFDTVSNTRTGGQFTGVVVTADGHILTAAHVNTPGNTYRVMFPNGKWCIAVGLGEIELEDTPTMPDVAMMKIVGKGDWPFAEMGWSSALVKNEPCISIAYPESLDQPLPMVRFGHIQEIKNQYGFIQSTCLMEPGDSGGPLFDVMGRVIGLHSAIDVAESDNFEIPVDLYRKYWTALNKEETYKSYPSVKDTVGNDPFADKINAIPALRNIDSNLMVHHKLAVCSIQIKSTIKGKDQRIQGTLFSLAGLPLKENHEDGSILVSKSSLVGNNPTLELAGRHIIAVVIARDKENDLVLLKTKSTIKGGINIKELQTDTVKFSQLGKFLISPLNERIGKVSVLGSLQFSLLKITSIGYLGVQVAYFGPLVFTTVQADSSADRVKLEKGDELLSINGVALKNRADFVRESKKYWPNDKITIQIKHRDSVFSKDVILDYKPQILAHHPAELFAGAKSTRRDGFNRVFAHDAILKPEENGGPVFDLEGHFYGVNIARFSRTSTIVIPAAVIVSFINAFVN